MKKLKSTFIPHKGNKYKPHAVTKKGYFAAIFLILAMQVTYNFQTNGQFKVLGYATSISASGLLVSTNSNRSASGLSPLSLSGQLNAAAQAKAQHMIANDYWAHVAPDGTTPWVFIGNSGYAYLTAGENLAYGFNTSQQTVTGWMNSPSHRANILNTAYEDVGFGIANGANFQGGENTVVVALYGDPLNSNPPPPPSTTTSSTGSNSASTTSSSSASSTTGNSSSSTTGASSGSSTGTTGNAPTPTPTPTPDPTPVTTPDPAPAPDPEPSPITQADPEPEEEAETANQRKKNQKDNSNDKEEELVVPVTTDNDISNIDSTQSVSNLQAILNGSATWPVYGMSLVLLPLLLISAYRHFKFLQNFVRKGEHLMHDHPLLEAAILYVVAWVILGASNGVVQ